MFAPSGQAKDVPKVACKLLHHASEYPEPRECREESRNPGRAQEPAEKKNDNTLKKKPLQVRQERKGKQENAFYSAHAFNPHQIPEVPPQVVNTYGLTTRKGRARVGGRYTGVGG